MKKIIFVIVGVVALVMMSFVPDAPWSLDDTDKGINFATNEVITAPSGTTYGIVGTEDNIIKVNTPFGVYSIIKDNGYYNVLGFRVRVIKKSANHYVLDNDGVHWHLDLNKCTVTKE